MRQRTLGESVTLRADLDRMEEGRRMTAYKAGYRDGLYGRRHGHSVDDTWCGAYHDDYDDGYASGAGDRAWLAEVRKHQRLDGTMERRVG